MARAGRKLWRENVPSGCGVPGLAGSLQDRREEFGMLERETRISSEHPALGVVLFVRIRRR